MCCAVFIVSVLDTVSPSVEGERESGVAHNVEVQSSVFMAGGSCRMVKLRSYQGVSCGKGGLLGVWKDLSLTLQLILRRQRDDNFILVVT